MAVPAKVHELVERFEANSREFRSPEYKERRVRGDFIDPLLESLGWDIHNRRGYSEVYREVVEEDVLKTEKGSTAPDYGFYIGGEPKFFLEAKKPSINVKGSVKSAAQLRSYGWTAKLPLSILTDFEEFAIYDCRFEPVETDEADTALHDYFEYDKYLDKWEEIAELFSHDAVLKGSLDKFAIKEPKGTATVDDAFLKEIEAWRGTLARNLALRNPGLTQRQLNHAVQMTIDRIIFLRMAEGREAEDYGRLSSLTKRNHVYGHLCDLFRDADERYNSGLFHFRSEPGHTEAPDDLTLMLKIDDDVLKGIIRGLYYPKSPYAFSVLPVDVLGQVYEQFLGKVIRLENGHKAVVEEKPEVRKAGGVYYTPTYVVDYIVKNTVGNLLEGKTPQQVSKLKIVDPACGSGSFLVKAYQCLLDWHLNYYIENDSKRYSKKLYQGRGGRWMLTIDEKRNILLNNIYGVDVDPQAVEVAKLSLLLKVLEGETQGTLERQLFRERALPDLGNNIKWGNSLLAPDFYHYAQTGFADKKERLETAPFNWRKEFPGAMTTGGFDTVIGNPPWGATFNDLELKYLRDKHARVVTRMIDSYIYFIDQAAQLAKREGFVGFVVPSTILNQVDARAVRDLLLNRGLSTLVSLGSGIFGAKVLNTSTILVSTRRGDSDAIALADLSALPLPDRKAALNAAGATGWREWKESIQHDPHLTFFVGEISATAILDRLRQEHPPLEHVLQGKIQRGVSPDVAAAHVVSKAEAEAEQLEQEVLRLSISGTQIKRYREWACDQYIIYTTRTTPIERFPNVRRHLERFKHLNTCKEVLQGKHPWWALHRPRDPRIFASPKLIGLTTSKTIELVYDRDDSVCVTDAMYIFGLLPQHDPWACMAILQSRAFLFLYRVANQGESRVIPQVKASKLQTLPYPAHGSSHPTIAELSRQCKDMQELHKELAAVKTGHETIAAQRWIDAVDEQINRLVYELYGLTEEEIKIVEGG